MSHAWILYEQILLKEDFRSLFWQSLHSCPFPLERERRLLYEILTDSVTEAWWRHDVLQSHQQLHFQSSTGGCVSHRSQSLIQIKISISHKLILKKQTFWRNFWLLCVIQWKLWKLLSSRMTPIKMPVIHEICASDVIWCFCESQTKTFIHFLTLLLKLLFTCYSVCSSHKALYDFRTLEYSNKVTLKW